jgi:hypothetical protein
VEDVGALPRRLPAQGSVRHADPVGWAPPFIDVRLEGRDRWSLVTVGAAASLVAAVILAVVGVPRTSLMQPLYSLGVVLPGCGLTRGMVALVSGDLSTAWAYNPAAFAVMAVALAAMLRAAVGVVSGRWVHARVRPSPAVIALATAAVALLWLRQQASADLLMG